MRSHTLLTFSVAFLAIGASAQTLSVKTGKVKGMSMESIGVAVKNQTGISVGKDGKTITVSSKAARLVVQTGPSKDMLSYRINGLRNPTISAPVGAKLVILFVNSDDDMFHNIRFTIKQPPFEAKVSVTTGSADLPHSKGEKMFSQEVTLMLPTKKGDYFYLCTTPGHAAAGMFGKLVVR